MSVTVAILACVLWLNGLFQLTTSSSRANNTARRPKSDKVTSYYCSDTDCLVTEFCVRSNTRICHVTNDTDVDDSGLGKV